MEALDDNMKTTGLTLNSIDRINLSTISKWAKFLGIVGMVFSALLLLMAIFFSSFLTMAFMNSGPMGSAMGSTFATIYSVILISFGALYLYISYQLFLAGRNLKMGLENDDQTYLSEGYKKLSTFFKIIGILTLIIVIFYAIIILLGFGSFLMMG